MKSKQPFTATQFFTTSLVSIFLSLAIILNITYLRPALHQLLDFGSFIAAAKGATAGQDPYGVDSPLVYRAKSDDAKRVLPSPNLNPPISILLFTPLARVDPVTAVTGWRVATLLLFGVALLILAKTYPNPKIPIRILWALSLAGFWQTLALGQIYAPILILLLGAWVLTEKGHHKFAGLALGVMIAIKPNFAFWLALLALAGYTVTVLTALVVALLLSLLPLFIYGPGLYQQWLTALSRYPSMGLLIAGNTSFQSLTARFGWPLLGTALSLLFIGGSFYFAYHNKNRRSELNTLGIVGSLLVSPFSWAGYTMLTLPIFFSRSEWSWYYKFSAAILSFPYIFILFFFQKSFFNSIFFGWFYGWGLILILADLLFGNPDVSNSFVENQP